MKKLIILLAVIAAPSIGFAENKSLDLNPANCAKVKGWSSQFEEGVSASIGVAVSELEFRRTNFWVTCDYMVSTRKGMYRCAIPLIIQPSKKGEMPFAGGGFGSVACNKVTNVN